MEADVLDEKRLRILTGREHSRDGTGDRGEHEPAVQPQDRQLHDGDAIIARCQQLNVSGMELRAQPVELFLGSPAAIAAAAAAGNRGRRDEGGGGGRGRQGDGAAGGREGAPGQAAGVERGRRGGGRAALTPEQQAAQKAAAEETRKWRSGVSLDKVREFRRKFDDAGIALQIIKWDGIFGMSDDEVDYCFQVSKALGASAL